MIIKVKEDLYNIFSKWTILHFWNLFWPKSKFKKYSYVKWCHRAQFLKRPPTEILLRILNIFQEIVFFLMSKCLYDNIGIVYAYT